MKFEFKKACFMIRWHHGILINEIDVSLDKTIPKEVLERDGKRYTECFIIKFNKKNKEEVVGYGLAKTHSLDNFCKNTGRKISLTKALEDFGKEFRAQVWTSYFAMRGGKHE